MRIESLLTLKLIVRYTKKQVVSYFLYGEAKPQESNGDSSKPHLIKLYIDLLKMEFLGCP